MKELRLPQLKPQTQFLRKADLQPANLERSCIHSKLFAADTHSFSSDLLMIDRISRRN